MKESIKLMVGVLVLLTTTVYAQQEVEMADTLRAEGKIYVIVGIILIVLAGLFVYLFLLDRKLKRIEDQLKKEKQQATG